MPDVPALPVLVLVAKASALLAVAGAGAFAVRRGAAARRHAVWAAAFVAVLVLPLGMQVVPAWYAGWVNAPAPVAAAGNGLGTSGPLEAPAALPGLPGLPRPDGADAAPAWTAAGVLRVAYGTGVLAVLAYGLLGALRLRRWRKASLPDRRLTDEAHGLAQTLGIRRAVQVRVSPGLPTPMTWGVRRPLILLPASAASWPEERRRVVFLHELAHVARYDALTQTLAFVGCAVLWFHPLAWWGAHAMRVERERACDDLVLATGTRASAYATHLLALARTLRPRAVPAFAAAVVRQSELESRIRAILAPSVRRGGVGRRGRAAAAALVTGVVVPVAAFQPWSKPRPALPAAAPAASGVASARPPAPEADAQAEPLRARYAVRPGGTLTFTADAGSIDVVPGDGSMVEVTVRRTFDVRLGGRSDGADATVRLTLADPSRRWRRGDRVETTIRVPRRYELRLRTAGGSVSVQRLDGSVHAQTSGGAVRLDGATGDVRAATSGGSMTVGRVDGRLALRTSGGAITLDGGAGGALVAETSGGSIQATLARAPAADVDLSTSGGSISVVLPADTDARVDARTTGGNVTSEFGPSRGATLRTTIGRGGPLVKLRTSGGSIALRRRASAARRLAAPTSGEGLPAPAAAEAVEAPYADALVLPSAGATAAGGPRADEPAAAAEPARVLTVRDASASALRRGALGAAEGAGQVPPVLVVGRVEGEGTSEASGGDARGAEAVCDRQGLADDSTDAAPAALPVRTTPILSEGSQ